jgi:membrane protein DedA with SNARE-associated domain
MFDFILSFIEANPDSVNWTIFALIFIESLFIAGLFTPATLIVPGVGALAATVGISPFEITFYATMGMVAGDSVSYGLGILVGNRLYDWVPNNYHGYIKQAQKFMEKYGILSVALGRFFGPLRCVVPFTAGSLGMNKRIFFPVTILSAPVWTSLYVLSGYFLGVAFVEYFNYVLIGFILVITIYTVYKDPMNLREDKKND